MSTISEIEEEKRKHIEFSNKVIKAIRILASVIFSVFILKIFKSLIKGLSFSPESTWEIVQVIVILYFLSWFLAALKGAEIQSVVLSTSAGTSFKSFPSFLALMVGFPIGAVSLSLVLFHTVTDVFVTNLFKISTIKLLSILLLIFWIWDIFWHFSVRRTMSKMIQSSTDILSRSTNKRYIENEQILLFEKFIIGKWRVIRIITGFLAILALLLVVFLDNNSKISFILTYFNSIDNFIAIFTLCFVVVFETWIWIMRYKLIVGLKVLRKIGLHYTLSRKPKKTS